MPRRDARANRIAHAVLERRGPGPEPVALLLGHGPALIAAILGVLKTGKAYVPVDPAHPQARSRRILQAVDAPLLLGERASLGRVSGLASGRAALLVDDLGPGRDPGTPAVAIPPDAIAYIIHTSGSTGVPKGAYQRHRNMLHLARHYVHGLALGPADRVTMLYSASVTGSIDGQTGGTAG